MRKIKNILGIILVLFFLCSCDSGLKGGLLYITDDLHPGTEIFTVKILEHTYNESSEKNIFSDYKETIVYGGYTWYVYDIPNGSWDIYIEYYEDGVFMNERESVYIEGDSSGNEWAAIWLLANYDYSVWTEQGSGNLKITSSMFK